MYALASRLFKQPLNAKAVSKPCWAPASRLSLDVRRLRVVEYKSPLEHVVHVLDLD